MTQALTATDTKKRTENGSDESGALFLDWPHEVGSLSKGSLFDEAGFGQHKLVFFDPYHFALTHKLRSKDKENSDVEYVDLGEREFLTYLQNVKLAKEKIHNFLAEDGILVIRSRIPKSHIKVRKKSSASVRKYTESIISAFFWLDEILGRRSFHSCSSKIVSYLNEEHPFAQVFSDCMVECFQTQNAISRGNILVIAVGGASGKAPLITRVSYLPQPGKVFFIPRFLVKDEHDKLCQVFKLLEETDVDDFQKPSWLQYYEDQVASYSPHRPQIERIDMEIESLLKQRALLAQHDSEVEKLPELLFERGGNLREAVIIALTTLGFHEINEMGDRSENMLTAKLSEGSDQRFLVKIAQPGKKPTPVERVDELAAAMSEYSSKVQVKGLLIGNGSAIFPPEKRTEWFDNEATASGRQNELCLVSTLDLFIATSVALSRANTSNIENIKASLRKDLVQCEGIFEINRPKYGI